MEGYMKNVLDELNKGTTMGIDAINFTLEKVKDENLKNVLTRLKKMYQDVSNKINRMYDGKPHETNILNKAMTWYGIEMKTMMDDSSSKISELIIQGVNMGIIEGRKLLNNKDINEEIKNLIDELIESKLAEIKNAEVIEEAKNQELQLAKDFHEEVEKELEAQSMSQSSEVLRLRLQLLKLKDIKRGI